MRPRVAHAPRSAQTDGTRRHWAIRQPAVHHLSNPKFCPNNRGHRFRCRHQSLALLHKYPGLTASIDASPMYKWAAEFSPKGGDAAVVFNGPVRQALAWKSEVDVTRLLVECRLCGAI